MSTKRPFCARTWLLSALACGLLASSASASKILMKDGRILEGNVAELASMVDKPIVARETDAPKATLVILIDDELRRTFVSQRRIAKVLEEQALDPIEKFHIPQAVAEIGGTVAAVGNLVRIEDFDEYGRRIVVMQTAQGQVSVIQGITEITPIWTKVEALKRSTVKNVVWDQRIATSSIPRETLDKILARQIKATNLDQRLKAVRLYLQSNRLKDAKEHLEGVIKDFPAQKGQFSRTVRELQQAYAQQALNEIQARKAAGQHRLALGLLERFPADGVSGETLQAVRQMRDQYQNLQKDWQATLTKIDEHLSLVKEPSLRNRIEPIRDEIAREWNLNTMDRLAAYRLQIDSADMPAEDKLALAISGWLVGTDAATRKISSALSLWDTRNRIHEYLVQPLKLERVKIVAALQSEEGATPEFVAKLLEFMKPPEPIADASSLGNGLFTFEAPTLKQQPTVTYFVQLPPDYDPHRRYPTVLTLHGAGTTPAQQIDWWAGGSDPNGNRLGQASRHGYIVIAPAWAGDGQVSYHYSAQEHAAVLNSLRDACRRFSIDSDRVFLSGHDIGGDAAWDIGLAHPDLWAGVIPIVARADKFVSNYWENAKYVPFYFVGGELDGDKVLHNADYLDKYIQRGFDTTVVEYLGRGHEHFSDEILRLFDWMNRCKRDFYPKDFTVRSLRTWDNYFWWLEVNDFPAKTTIDAEEWPPKRGIQALSLAGTVGQNNLLNVKTGAGSVTLWLSPEIMNFKQKANFAVKGGRLRAHDPFVAPDLTVMLDDARTRADRQHPFWAKVEMPMGRVNHSP